MGGVSKSLRFQILRRDGHRCHYCGNSPPDVKLAVDHILPVALGGSDSPDNLVTSCTECNAGKGAAPPDASSVEQVSARNEEWSAAICQAAADLHSSVDDYRWFTEYWGCWTNGADQPMPLASNWRSALDVWLQRGLTTELILDNVETAMNKTGMRNDYVFRYFAGCCWRTVERLESRAEQIVAERQNNGGA